MDKLEIYLDPLGKHKERDPEHIKLELGLLPSFIIAAANRDEDVSFKDAMEAEYGFPMNHPLGGEVLSDGTYQYPGEDDLYPLASTTLPDGIKVFIYHYGIIAFKEPEQTTVWRMD